jgi:response regulator RpfG family c-di-GMP phosphodiesterase
LFRRDRPAYNRPSLTTPGRQHHGANARGQARLLVDDDGDILTSMQAAFEPTGAVVETANNGNKAVELAEKNQPDLVSST